LPESDRIEETEFGCIENGQQGRRVARGPSDDGFMASAGGAMLLNDRKKPKNPTLRISEVPKFTWKGKIVGMREKLRSVLRRTC
jgi:hypothetical protein